jgi:hypothetical protein
MTSPNRFYEVSPTSENYWRAIILFGRNVASYKFALAKALFDLRSCESDLIRLDELAVPFSRHISAHLQLCNKQATSQQSRFLDSVRSFNRGELEERRLFEETARLGFVNVIEAFHNVHGAELPMRFFVDERKTCGGIRLTDEFRKLSEDAIFSDLNAETEARWRLVETAWELNLPKHVVVVTHDEATKLLHAIGASSRRVTVTGARDALNGYQKGHCFYCFRRISLDAATEDLADVDHFFPFKLKYCSGDKPINGVANLVLACKECNRGVRGKFDRVPELRLLERLHLRNEYLIKSHHPLRETLMLQTGLNEGSRHSFLQEAYNCARTSLIQAWVPEQCGDKAF